MGSRKGHRKVAVLVAGAHRSGTSALARVFSLLGFALPRTLHPANAANERGYWESVHVTRLNDEALALAGLDWRSWLPPREGWQALPAAGALKAKALAVLEDEFGNASHIVLKDPRLCRLIGFWREVLEDFGARPVIACPIRNPLEVAASLEKRNALVPALSHLIWLRYVLDAEFASRGLPRSFASYDALLADWRPVADRLRADLGIAWPRAPEEAAPEIDAFLSAASRHHAQSLESVTEDANLPEWLRTTYVIVDCWARKGETRKDFKAFDRVRGELDGIPPGLLPLIGSVHDHAEETRKNKKRIARRNTEITQLTAEAKANAEQLQETQVRLDQTVRRLAQREIEAGALERKLQETGARLAGTVEQLARRDAEAKAHELQLKEVRAQLAQTQTQVEKARLQNEEGARRLAQRDAEAERSAAKQAELEARIADAAQQFARSEAESGLRAARLEEAMAQLAEAARKVARRDAEAEAAAARLSYAEAQLAEFRARLAETQSQLADSARLLAERDAEAEAMATQRDELQDRLAAAEGNLAKHEAEIGRRRKQVKDARTAMDLMTRDLSNERENQVALQAVLEETNAVLTRSRRTRKNLRQDIDRLQAELVRMRASRAWRVAQALEGAARKAADALGLRRRRSGKAEKEAVAAVLASKLFDRAWYMAKYPDVAAGGIEPALHYVRHGAAEKRDPGPEFSTRWYLATHLDVAEAGLNPLAHYLLHGMAEGRDIKRSSEAGATPAVPAAPSVPTEAPMAAAEPVSFPLPREVETPWVRQRNLVRGDGQLSFELSGLIVGTAPAAQTDVENARAAVDDPVRALVAFCRVSGADPRRELRCEAGHTPLDVAARLDALQDPAACAVVALPRGAAPAAVADLWYDHDHALRLRFDSAAGANACVARFFQYDLAADGRLVLAGERLLEGREAEFADASLANPFLPVLVTLSSPLGQLLAVSLLPFPSLCRGGAHYAELCAASAGAGYFENLEATSRSLLAEMLDGSGTAPEFAVARIEVDLQDATGAERIFSANAREWLAAAMRIRIVPANVAAVAQPKVRAHLEESLAPPAAAQRPGWAERIAARERSGRFALRLPPDGLPSLKALVSRSLDVPAGVASCVGSFVVSDGSTASPCWTVSLPPMGDELLALQPAGACIGYPVLTALSPRDGEAEALGGPLPHLSVRFRGKSPRHPASLIMPVAPEVPGPLLRRANGSPNGVMVSVVLPFSVPAQNAFAALVESMQLQTLAAHTELVAVVDAGNADSRRATEAILHRAFPGRYQLIEHEREAGRNARINLAAAQAAGRFLLIAGGPVALHDPRTLETLCALADHDKVASAGCVLLRTAAVKKAPAPAFRSGGIFPSAGARDRAPEPAFSEPDCHAVFPCATYPVAGNSSALFMARADVWRALGGFAAHAYADDCGDIEYGVRAISQGCLHLCTSAVTAELYDLDFRAPYAGAMLSAGGPAADAQAIARAASLLEALKA